MPELVDEQANFLVFTKRSGDNFHTENGEPGFFQSIKNVYKDVFPVHRLDRVTSGLLIVAKNLESCQKLNRLFVEQKIQKYYLAISDRKPKKKQGWIIGDMEKSRRGNWKLCMTKRKPAVTQFFSKSIDDGRRVYLLKPCTGKTHQLRVAMKSIGSPICGDPNYYPGESKKTELRCYLHSYALNFEMNGKKYFYCDKPKKEGLFNTKSFLDLISDEYSRPHCLDWPKRKK